MQQWTLLIGLQHDLVHAQDDPLPTIPRQLSHLRNLMVGSLSASFNGFPTFSVLCAALSLTQCRLHAGEEDESPHDPRLIGVAPIGHHFRSALRVFLRCFSLSSSSAPPQLRKASDLCSAMRLSCLRLW